jgi:hypothetical protein
MLLADNLDPEQMIAALKAAGMLVESKMPTFTRYQDETCAAPRAVAAAAGP